MGVGGTFQANKYTGGWSFTASGTDSNGDSLTDTAGGAFEMDYGVASGAAPQASSISPRVQEPDSMKLHLDP
jgi:hypothetical protein